MERETVKYKFQDYYKYSFFLSLEDGSVIVNKEQDAGSVYRLCIEAEGFAIKHTKDNGDVCFWVDGYEFNYF